MNGAANFVIAPNDRIQLSLPGELRQVPTIFLQCLIGALRILTGHSLVPSDLLERGEQALACQIQPTEHAALFHHGQDDVFHTHEVVPQLLHVVFGFREERS